jgi:hypothetical protein
MEADTKEAESTGEIVDKESNLIFLLPRITALLSDSAAITRQEEATKLAVSLKGAYRVGQQFEI